VHQQLLVLSLVYVCSAAPHVPDPFQTLADIYEAKGDTDKRMQVCFYQLNFYLFLFFSVCHRLC